MNDVTVTGVEDGFLVLESRTGERFRLPIDEVLHSHVRRVRSRTDHGPRVSPKEIQSQLRAGLSAGDVAELTGASLETIERFEGPVLAELEHTVSSALSVPVLAEELPEDADATFGSAVRHRIDSLDAVDEHWASWKDPEEGWRIKLTFTAGGVDHDARWAFDAKRHALTPINDQAALLSRPGGGPSTMIPRLRAVSTEAAETESFAPEAFVEEEPPAPPVQPRLPKAARAAMNRGDDGHESPHDQTADLLEALRRRRGEREAAPQPEQDTAPAEGPTEPPAPLPSAPAADTPSSSRPRTPKKGRAALPSWDEIVFGAKPDED
ncbi:septation protein SepH [Mycetocola reblochoni]|uniref:DUF3071 domain-containing protein n=2 Tax=Mycetocola reblochoni TaxID=331618 RepID=A0A3L6ZJH2_9MICO|nr:septation protein SepH [Mycetocola reblochoni]RLP67987.1 DUF3071 domain-containing protein [Mycetocola reblochoni]